MTARMGIDTDKAIRMLLAGRQMRSVAQHFGVDKVTLVEALKADGVEFRGAVGREQPHSQGRLVARVGDSREARYARRVWIDDPTYWSPRELARGYWLYPDPPRGHDDVQTYTDYGCRCPDCRAAASDYQWYIKRGLKPPRS